VEEISQIPIFFAATIIALFGHFPEQVLAERAATFIRNRELSTEEVVRIANSASTGMLHIFEMDFGFGGTLRPAPPHPGLAAWVDLLEDWAGRQDLTPLDRLAVMTIASELGSEWARAKLEAEIFAIDDMDGPEWTEDDASGLALSRALREVRRRKPLLSLPMIEKIVASTRFNVVTSAIGALQALGNFDALQRLIDLHEEKLHWALRDTIANAIELMAARQGIAIQKVGGRYQLAR